MANPYLVLLVIAAILSGLIVRRLVRQHRELGRFQTDREKWWSFLTSDMKRFVDERAALRVARAASDPRVLTEGIKLSEAGLQTLDSRERFHLLREMLLIASAVASAVAWRFCEPGTAAVLMVSLVGVGGFGPRIWLRSRRQLRARNLHREMPLLLGLLHAGTTGGAELVRILDRLADILGEGAGKHSLVRELRRAQWYARMGGSWEQGLRAAQLHVSSREEAKTLEGLVRVVAHEGAKHTALAALTRESLDTYRIQAEQRAAALPVQIAALLLMMALGWMCLLEIPYRIG